MQNNKSIVITRKNVLDVKGEKYVPLDLLFSHKETLFIEDPTALFRRYGWQGNILKIPASGLYTDAGDFYWSHSYVDGLADRSKAGIINNLLYINDSNTFETYCLNTQTYSWVTVGSLMINRNLVHGRARTGIRWMMFIPEDIYLKLRKKIYEDKQPLDIDLDVDPLFKVGYLVFDESVVPSSYLKDFRTHIADCGGKPRTQVQKVEPSFFDSMHIFPLDSLGLEIINSKWQVKAFKDFVDDEFSRLGFEEKTEETEEVSTCWTAADSASQDESRSNSEESEYIITEENIDIDYNAVIREFAAGVQIETQAEETATSNSTESSEESILDESEGITDEELQEVRRMVGEMSNAGLRGPTGQASNNRTTSNE